MGGWVRHHGSLMVVASRLLGRTKVQHIVLKGADRQTRLLYSLYVVFLSFYSLALTRMSLRDFPLLYDKRGSSLTISFNRGCFFLRFHFSLSICLRPDSTGQYCITNDNIREGSLKL